MPGWVQRLLEDLKQQPDDAQSQENEIPSNQSDSEPDSNSEDLVPAADDTSAAEAESSGAVRDFQSSHYWLGSTSQRDFTSVSSGRAQLGRR